MEATPVGAGLMAQAGCFLWRKVLAVAEMDAWIMVMGEAFGCS